MDIEFNNAGSVNTNGTGWFVGFSEWANPANAADLRYIPAETRSHHLSIKWMEHPAHDPRGVGKPLSEGRTISLLVSEQGRFRIQFSEHPDFPAGQGVEHVLEQQGDFVIWGENLYHRWVVDQTATILTVRWIPD